MNLLFTLLWRVLILNPTLSSIPPSCTCVLFNSSGLFHSPNFPSPLTNISCILYHFQAVRDQFVQIVFHSFSLPQRKLRACTSFVRIFDHPANGVINYDETPDFEFCENEIKSGQIFYSRDASLIMQIVHTQESSKGFVGEYKFLEKDNFTSDAIQISDTSYRVEKTKGRLMTPDYPYFYPSNVNYSYIIPNRKGHQIVLASTDFDLGSDSVLSIYDTKNGRKLVQTYTHSSRSVYFTSPSSLLLHFMSGRVEKAGKRGRGMVIEFIYEPSFWPHPAPPKVTGECLLTITSEREKHGNFSTKHWVSKNSNLPTKCRILFQGFAGERVSVKFTYFNLYVAHGKMDVQRCVDVDYMAADVRVGSRLSRIDTWCSNDLPPALMSNTNLLQIEYTTKSSRSVRESSRTEYGFHLNYEFHTDWNMDHMQAKVDKTKACRFIFNSSIQSSGKLWSVNYPGLYPRNLYCEYIFHGSEDEIVHIHFEYFDVEGFNQCDETTQSDFVLFSNYQTHDRTNRRFCGKVAPRGPILSESNYFRMIFFTNDIFDATGFHAHYQFITQQKSQISRVKLTTSSLCERSNFSIMFCIIFLKALLE